MANMIARLGVLLGIDSAEFKRGIEEASKKLEQFGDAAERYGKVAATSLVAASVAALKYADDIADVAKANDVTIDSILKLREALSQNGGEAENASRLMSSFNSFVIKAADGSFEAQRSFKTLGVSLQDISRMSIDQLFSKTAESLAGIEDPILRNARAFEIYGKAAKGVDFVGFNDTLKETNSITERQAEAVKDAADMFDKLEKHARDTALVITTELGPPLKATVEYFEQMHTQGNVFAESLKVTYQTIAVVVSDVAFVIKGISDELTHTVENAKVLATQGIDAAKKLNAEYNTYRENERAKLDEFQRRVMGGGGGYGGGTSKFDDPRRLDREKEKTVGRTATPGIDREAEKQKQRDKEIYERFIQRLALEQKTNMAYEERQNMVDRTLEKEQDIFKLEMNSRFYKKEDLSLEREIIEIKAKQADNLEKIRNEANLSDSDRQERLKKENELAEKAIELARERNRLTKEFKEGDIFTGMENKMAEYMNSMRTQVEIGAEMFTHMMSAMESALDQFVTNGKLSFKDLARSIIQDLIRIQMRAQMTNLFSSFFKSMGWGVSPATNMSQFEYAMVSGYADGGDPPTNKPSIVGERGPELFIPKTAGTIIPNNQLMGSLGGQTNVTNNYINAIDTKSFEQRLLESNQAIWSANQYANKSLASNGRRA